MEKLVIDCSGGARKAQLVNMLVELLDEEQRAAFAREFGALGVPGLAGEFDGEGRFVAPEETALALAKNGQVATQYVDLGGEPTLDVRYNPNGSLFAIEGITSPDGRVLGKMAHLERSGKDLYRNVPGNTQMPLFEGAADYFKL